MRECTSCMAFFNIDVDILQKNEKEQKIAKENRFRNLLTP